ncbi:MAG: hypothetical protein NC408_05635 [Candidatus Gastranaerophilales bacterium]|nr:hypothetical protein [Candidatus Gastranaerophilales bacterium]MCM1074040.1 hypothetical protein [Bacteroides sp.]
MGMAASQARYLALVARKSNCEYEGQQINQARTVLSNQSANLFNQMLGLKVPVPPSTSDYTKAIYTYKDGIGTETKLENWQQLSYADPDYNYVVTRSYSTRRYTGSIKKMNDPQVQFTNGIASAADIRDAEAAVARTKAAYEAAMKSSEDAKTNLDNIQKRISEIKANQAKLSNYASPLDNITKCEYKSGTETAPLDEYEVTTLGGTPPKATLTTYKNFSTLTPAEQEDIKNSIEIQGLINNNAITADDLSNYYFNVNDNDGSFTFIKGSDLNTLTIASGLAGNTGLENVSVDSFQSGYINTKLSDYQKDLNPLLPLLTLAQTGYDNAQTAVEQTEADYNAALEAYNGLQHPTYIGNCDLVPLAELNKDQKAEIDQVIADMKGQGYDTNIEKCFDENGNYLGGIYSFKLNGVTYYTTYEDLETSYNSGTGPNNIDGQTKLPYYNASYIDTKIEETEKALVETDGQGRFTSIRFEDDSVVYTLNMGTETDEAAYQDAMNQYYYDNAVYDKTIRDINAKTSIIQQEDQQLELRLKQLDTEQSALSTEMDAVKKVVDDNVESSFKTFGG